MPELKEFLKPEIIWFLVGIALLMLEFVLPGLIICFFGIGACVVAIACLLFDISFNSQLIVFVISSVVLLLSLRKWFKSIFMGHITGKQNISEQFSEFVGERAVVKSSISPKLGGKVEFHGTDWQAQADEEIPEGSVVEIIGKENITLKVKAV